MSTTEQVRALVAPLLDERRADLGDVELYDVELAGSVLRVLVDRPGGIDLEAIGELSRLVSGALDDLDERGSVALPERYTLEVSSPGLERPLRTATHFARAVGSSVHVKTHPDVEGDRRLEGTLVEADDEGITIALAGNGAAAGGARRLGYDQIDSARTAFQWNQRGPAPKPGGRARTRSSTGQGKRS